MHKINDEIFPEKSIVKLLNKELDDIQREDLLDIIDKQNIRQINLHYTGIDGKLKELKVPVNNLKYAEQILAQGERIDGSSIFPGIIDSSNSDMYIVPIYKTAFISPFEENTLGILCRFMDRTGKPAPATPDNVLLEAHNYLKEKTGCSLHALGELEFYLIYDRKSQLFTGHELEQRGYHQTSPFVRSREMLNEMMRIISNLTASVKYAHSEVGYIHSLKSIDPEINGKTCEQYEIEFLPRPIDEMAAYITIAKWVIRNVAYKWGCSATFTPKLEEGMAGSGLHIHMHLEKDGRNITLNNKGELSTESKKLIGGLCKFAPSLTAFGNTVSSAYLRLVAHQEAPTQICWSDSNRSALIRVPLGWSHGIDMEKIVNPKQKNAYESEMGARQTIELRSPDGSAHVTLLLAAITVAVEHGLTSDDCLEIAEKSRVTAEDKKLPNAPLPASCAESAAILKKHRTFYEKEGLFPKQVIEYISKNLIAEDDHNINDRYSHLPAEKRLSATRSIMHKDLHKQ